MITVKELAKTSDATKFVVSCLTPEEIMEFGKAMTKLDAKLDKWCCINFNLKQEGLK